MILGVGIDSVEIERFAHWKQYSHKKLSRLFSQEEIDYCLSSPFKSAERFALRFAAREAFFKAFSQLAPGIKAPFLTVCKQVAIKIAPNGHRYLEINWSSITQKTRFINPEAISCLSSFTHTKTTATALVFLQKAP